MLLLLLMLKHHAHIPSVHAVVHNALKEIALIFLLLELCLQLELCLRLRLRLHL